MTGNHVSLIYLTKVLFLHKTFIKILVVVS